MLLRYIVGNYKSIGHPIEFSMFPTTSNVDDKYVTILHTKAGDWKVLRRGCFFGPNASGKSSFVESLAFVKKMVVNGTRSGKAFQLNQFRGEVKELKNLSTFQFVLYADGDVYEYGFSLNRTLVAEEWLSKLTANGFQSMFTRKTNTQKKTEIIIGTALAQRGKPKELAELLKDTIKEEQCGQLFLFKLYDNGMKHAGPVVRWFERLTPIFPSTKLIGLPLRVSADNAFKCFLQEKLASLDTGVLSLEAKDDRIDFYEYAEKLGLSPDRIEEIISIKEGIVQINGKYFMFSGNGAGAEHEAVLKHCVFTHEISGKKVAFEINEESDGTQRLTDLLPLLFEPKGAKGKIFIVDEIDRSLHTKLTAYILNEFLGTQNSSQLIFSAHDVNIINLDFFCQDEIWFVEKKKTGESIIRPMSDFQVQAGQDAIKAYLNGRFGAVPQIGGEFK